MDMPTVMKNSPNRMPRNGWMSATTWWRNGETANRRAAAKRRIGEQHAGEKGAHRERHAGVLHQPRRAQYQQQRDRHQDVDVALRGEERQHASPHQATEQQHGGKRCERLEQAGG